MLRLLWWALALMFLLHATGVRAQAQSLPRPTGNVSVMGAGFPDRAHPPALAGPAFMPGVDGDGAVGELRARLFLEQKLSPSEFVSFTFSGFAEGLLGRSETAIARVHEATASIRLGRLDLHAGYGPVVWGRLDELQPTDVINPLDVSRFFFEGRSEARLPVTVVRGRWYFTDAVSLEGVYVPVFRRGRFDQLAESGSPFNIVPPFTTPDPACVVMECPPVVIPVERAEPSKRVGHAQGGARFNATTGRVDWSLTGYRGFEPFGLYELRFGPPIPPLTTPQPFVEERFPRFTMVGGDFETVAGPWGIRGEVAAFVRDHFQGDRAEIVEGSSLDAGLGVDRRAGNYRFSGTVLYHHESTSQHPGPGKHHESTLQQPGTLQHPAAPFSTLEHPLRRDVSFIVSADRTFARQRYQFRAFSVYNPSERSSFVRGIFTAKLRDDVAVEASGGWFAGDGRDTIGRFADSDFVYARLRYYW